MFHLWKYGKHGTAFIAQYSKLFISVLASHNYREKFHSNMNISDYFEYSL